jgi:hypothetical protein
MSVLRGLLFGGNGSCTIEARATFATKETSMKPKVTSTKKIVAAFVKCKGNPGKTAKMLGIDRTTLWRMQQNNPELAQQMADAWESKLDTIEESAIVMAEGIPKMETLDVLDKKGNVIGKEEKQVGWICPPDARFAKMLLDARAKSRGYGKMDIDLGASEGTQILITNTVVRRGAAVSEDGVIKVIPD